MLDMAASVSSQKVTLGCNGIGDGLCGSSPFIWLTNFKKHVKYNKGNNLHDFIFELGGAE